MSKDSLNENVGSPVLPSKFKNHLKPFKAYGAPERVKVNLPKVKIERVRYLEDGSQQNYYDDDPRNVGLSYRDFEIDTLEKQGVDMREVYLFENDHLRDSSLATEAAQAFESQENEFVEPKN